jgi:dTDP-4-amino-4,6-dideoxygalactose transaminase
LDNVQAAVLDVKLRHFPSWVEHRRRIAELYRQGLADVSGIRLPHFEGIAYRDSYQNYVIRADNRDALRAHLTERGVETLISWPKPVWEHPALGLGHPNLPATAKLCREVISLPMSAETTPDQVQITVNAIREFKGK